MQIFKIAIGFLALVLAWSLLFRTGIIFRLNAWLKENIFNDQVVLYSRRRLALLLFFLGVISLFSGVGNFLRDPAISQAGMEQLLMEAKYSFKMKEYQRVVHLCRQLLKSDPKNLAARELLARAYWALGDREEARKTIKVSLVLDPDNPTIKSLAERFSEKKEKAKK